MLNAKVGSRCISPLTWKPPTIPGLPPLFGENSEQFVPFAKQPFNSSSALGQFGKQWVYDQPINPQTKDLRDLDAKNAELMNFLRD